MCSSVAFWWWVMSVRRQGHYSLLVVKHYPPRLLMLFGEALLEPRVGCGSFNLLCVPSSIWPPPLSAVWTLQISISATWTPLVFSLSRKGWTASGKGNSKTNKKRRSAPGTTLNLSWSRFKVVPALRRALPTPDTVYWEPLKWYRPQPLCLCLDSHFAVTLPLSSGNMLL